MLVSETRLSRPFHDGLGWVVGASIVDNRTRQQREYGAAPFQAPLTGVTNRITELTGYGEATVEILHSLVAAGRARREEEHTPELQSLMRNSYAVFCLKTKRQR